MSVSLNYVDGSMIQISMDPVDGSMRVTRVDPMVVCPLDPSHIIESSQMQCHLERCLIGDLVEMKCPWNPHHIVDECSYQYHVDICEDKSLPVPEEPSADK